MNRDERLRRRRESYRRRMAEETPEQRNERLARRRERDRARRLALCTEQRQAILEQRRSSYRSQVQLRDNTTQTTPYSVDDQHIIQKMSTFHNDIGSLQPLEQPYMQASQLNVPLLKLTLQLYIVISLVKCHSHNIFSALRLC